MRDWSDTGTQARISISQTKNTLVEAVGGYVKDLPAPVLVDRVASDPVQNEERLHRFWSQNVVTLRACAGGEQRK